MLNVIVTGGGTIAPIDAVRSITNTSTGRFSAQITEAFLNRGAAVTHLCPESAIRPFEDRSRLDLDADIDEEIARMRRLREEFDALRHRLRLRTIIPATVSKYSEALRESLTMRPVEIAVLAMAVSDYEPAPSVGKVASDRDQWTMSLHRTPKVIRRVREWSPRTFLVGFKLLSDVTEAELIDTARLACVANGAELTIANDLRLKQHLRHTIHVVDHDGLVETIGPDGPMAERLVNRILATHHSRTADRANA